MAQGRGVGKVTLGYVIRPIPPSLLEHGGGDTPEEEHEKQARLDTKREAWIRSERRAAEEPMRRARDALRRAGLLDHDIRDEFMSIVHATDLTKVLIDSACELGCRFIVVARGAFAWYGDRHAMDVVAHLRRDAGDEMVIAVDEHDDLATVKPEERGERR
jgi:hypothetical protein